MTLFVLGILTLPAPALGDAPVLELPIDCRMGERCFVQNYVDHDPSPDRRDYTCGRLSYDGHTGTDIRLPDYPAMRQGVAVRAAATGVVRATRDEMDDIDMREADPASLRNRGGGNTVILDHGDGWQTIYAHLRRGSVAVKPGERVEAGQTLALVGLSGLTMFPHVHFEVRHGSTIIDPFIGASGNIAADCHTARTPLWSATAAEALAYHESGGLSAGFAVAPPDPEKTRKGANRADTLGQDADTLAYWVDVLGTLAGDEAWFRIVSPKGIVLSERMTRLTAPNVSWFGFSGVKRPAEGWMPGSYRGVFRLMRDGKPVVEMERRIDIR
ncbi:M23 family metallopeptidase [Azospirillum sp. A1-3]|uniref:M23 family metallopeptidase n=1 Tax=Azospirillum sp. A1-3 TaxID=185874 RepID=UPI00207751B7|nr:M23 family metallopeptidase [Azospirillum sp. A1-3]MCM8738669.1 M23 family metallopeptidase [Azospirillum sp. A1-3]